MDYQKQYEQATKVVAKVTQKLAQKETEIAILEAAYEEAQEKIDTQSELIQHLQGQVSEYQKAVMKTVNEKVKSEPAKEK